MHTYVHKYIPHTYIHACVTAYVHACVMRTFTHARTHTYIYTRAHTQVLPRFCIPSRYRSKGYSPNVFSHVPDMSRTSGRLIPRTWCGTALSCPLVWASGCPWLAACLHFLLHSCCLTESGPNIADRKDFWWNSLELCSLWWGPSACKVRFSNGRGI
jgi:hypothetical protein